MAKKGQCEFNFLKVSTKKTSETINFFNMTVMVLFGNKFTKVMSQHAASECNGTHLIQCRRVSFKTILNKENENRVCRAQN